MAARATLIALLLCVLPTPLLAAAGSAAGAEIDALIAGIGSSGCRFQRNGQWHDAAQAKAHLQRKRAWLQRRGLAGDAELFIARAATASSVSGRVYRIACPGQPESDSAAWFTARLQQLRGGR